MSRDSLLIESLCDLVLRPRSNWSTVSDDVWNNRDEWAGPVELEVWLAKRLSSMTACMSLSGISGWAVGGGTEGMLDTGTAVPAGVRARTVVVLVV